MKAKETGLGLYCHVPFCASTCDFCAFYQEKPHRKDLDRYLAGMEKELAWIQPDRPIDTVFWGGGTPGLLPATDLKRLGEAVLEFAQQQPLEWTVEMAPSTVKPDKLKLLRDLGVNRISMGVQSFQESFLEGLGRLHRPRQIYQAYDWIRVAGFENVNLDLMIALPGQTVDDLKNDLEEVCRLDPEHLSAYCLTFEEDTALWVKLSQGKIKQDIEKDADLYEFTWEFLTDAGYDHYEISNFSKPGFECVHNLNTWKMKEWIGIGPSAASQYRNIRYSNAADLDVWLDQTESDVKNRCEVQLLTEADLLEDTIIFGLRMGQGISLNELQQRFPQAPMEELRTFFVSLETDGLVTFENNDRAKLTLKGKLLADKIAVEFLGLAG
ncbi:MAG: radical SAM family heme chaperone HemW [Verrucomicrobia bacterium]|nr:radical SAM family heme chaperone HemW [Verrucomicrobiota bacterium]